jgi:hypothetical protein
MKKKILRIGLYIGGAILIILTIFYFLGAYEAEIVEYFGKKRDAKIMEQAESQRLMYLNLQQNDNYGGKTPEETLDLYIEALKALDIELASKYYEISLEEPNLQKREVEDLKTFISKEGNLDLIIEEVENIKNLGKKNIWSETEVSFVYSFITEEEIQDISIISREEITTIIPKGTELDVGYALKLNSYTKVWKIIQ